MKILTHWLRSYLPVLDVDDAQLAEDLTLRGIAVEGVFELNDAAGDSDGALFDMDITTNRVDAMNHYGIAREVAAMYGLTLKPLLGAQAKSGPATQVSHDEAAAGLPVRNEAPELCGRFTAQIIRGVSIAPSHGVVAHYFSALEQKQISNAVDVTNFVLQSMGHPTHAFDLDKIEGGLVIRLAREGEQLRLLDGSTRTLVAADLVVADERKALALAGVMGGWDSMITAETRNIVVEAAWFDPASVRASSRRHLLHTDASHRFERGADFAAAPVANALVCQGILAACGGTLEGDLVDLISPAVQARTQARPPVLLSVHNVQRWLGQTLAPEGITAALIERYLQALGCTLTAKDDNLYEVTLPSWRLDLTREIDLVEEIARVYGYNKFANTLPSAGVMQAHPLAAKEQAVRQRLFTLGFSEAVSSTFASAVESALFTPQAAAVALENPLSEEAANLRPALLPGMVAMLAGNLTRDVLTARLFEVGAVFAGSAAEVRERPALALGLTGKASASVLESPADDGFYELKGAVEAILHLFQTEPAGFVADTPAGLEPGRSAQIMLGGKVLGGLGQLSAGQQAKRKLRQPLWLAELDLDALYQLPLRQTIAQELSRFQAVERDFSFTFVDAVQWTSIARAIESLKIEELRWFRPVELWRDRNKFPGVYSVLVRVNFQAAHHTLTEEELTGWWAAIIAALQGLGGIIRDR